MLRWNVRIYSNCPKKGILTIYIGIQPFSTPGSNKFWGSACPRIHTHEWYCISSTSRFGEKNWPTDPPNFQAKRANKPFIFLRPNAFIDNHISFSSSRWTIWLVPVKNGLLQTQKSMLEAECLSWSMCVCMTQIFVKYHAYIFWAYCQSFMNFYRTKEMYHQFLSVEKYAVLTQLSWMVKFRINLLLTLDIIIL